jgi:hypothetical protein
MLAHKLRDVADLLERRHASEEEGHQLLTAVTHHDRETPEERWRPIWGLKRD